MGDTCAGGRELFSTRFDDFWSTPCPNEATEVLELTEDDGATVRGVVNICRAHVLALNAERA